MTVDIAAGSARFEIGRVIQRMFDAIGKNLVSFTVLSLIFSLPYLIFAFRGLLAGYLHLPFQPLLTSGSLIARYLGVMSSFAISLMFSAVSRTVILFVASSLRTIVWLRPGCAGMADWIIVCMSLGLALAR